MSPAPRYVDAQQLLLRRNRHARLRPLRLLTGILFACTIAIVVAAGFTCNWGDAVSMIPAMVGMGYVCFRPRKIR